MITINQAVTELLHADELAQEALREGILNFSAYAENIQKQVEKMTFKTVRHGTIVVALSRIAKTVSVTQKLKPEVKIIDLSVKSPLTAITYGKTADLQRRVPTLNPFLVSPNDIFALIEGPTQITVFCASRIEKIVENHLGKNPLEITINLSAVTLQLHKAHAQQPNILYALLSTLAAKHINLSGTVVTHSEVSFIVEKDKMDEAIKSLQIYS